MFPDSNSVDYTLIPSLLSVVKGSVGGAVAEWIYTKSFNVYYIAAEKRQWVHYLGIHPPEELKILVYSMVEIISSGDLSTR